MNLNPIICSRCNSLKLKSNYTCEKKSWSYKYLIIFNTTYFGYQLCDECIYKMESKYSTEAIRKKRISKILSEI